jgi:two-component system, chemotaxis family, chemotaxis protein CheY
VDIVFTDINMPQMSGLELVEQMSKDGLMQNVPVVIVSTERSKARIDELRRQGIKAYIKKPFKPEDLKAVIHEVLGSTSGGEQ